MIINNQRSDVLEVAGEGIAKTATIDINKIKKLQYILTEGLYKDAMSATIVELANNGVDAIVESGKDPIQHPVVVELKSLNREYGLSIKDAGIGMTKEFFETRFMNLLDSTKEDDNEAIGCFGLGGKSWASLKRAVTFTLVKDGKKCKYICYKGEEMIDFDLILEEDVDEPNGVLFEMPILDYKEYSNFCEKACQKLAYYDTVVLIIDGIIWENKIYRNDLFQYTIQAPYGQLHLCLKDVVYDIDFSKLGISPIHLPVAIRFGLTDGITPTPSRESILYNRETIELLHTKIKELANYFAEKWNESVKEPLRFRDVYSQINNNNKTVVLAAKDFEVNNFLSYASIPVNSFSVKGMMLRNPSWYKNNIYSLMDCIHIKAEYNWNGVWKTARVYFSLVAKFETGEKMILTDELRGNAKEYIKEQVGKRKFFVSLSVPKDLEWYRKNILGSVEKENWRKHIIEWQEAQKQIIEDYCVDYRGVETKQAYLDWLDKYKIWKKETREKAVSNYNALNKGDDEITIAYGRAPLLGNNFVFEKATFKLKDIPKTASIVITFKPEEIEQARNLAALLVKEKVAIIGIREKTKIKASQFITLNQYMSDNKPFRRIATSLLIQKTLKQYEATIGRNNEIINKCLLPVDIDIKELTKYKHQVYTGAENEILEAISSIAKDLNLYDEEIMPTLRRVHKALETFDFIQFLEKPRHWDEEKVPQIKKLINQMLLFKKKYYNELENCEIVYKEKVQEEEPELV